MLPQVGLASFCQWAKSIGCRVIGTVGSDSKIDIAKKMDVNLL